MNGARRCVIKRPSSRHPVSLGSQYRCAYDAWDAVCNGHLQYRREDTGAIFSIDDEDDNHADEIGSDDVNRLSQA